MSVMCLESLTRSDGLDDDMDCKHVVLRVIAMRPAGLNRLRVYVSFRLFIDLRGEQYSRRKSQ